MQLLVLQVELTATGNRFLHDTHYPSVCLSIRHTYQGGGGLWPDDACTYADTRIRMTSLWYYFQLVGY